MVNWIKGTGTIVAPKQPPSPSPYAVPQRGILRGNVKEDISLAPLAAVDVKLYYESNGTKGQLRYQAKTDTSGNFAIMNYEYFEGVYWIAFSKIGYAPLEYRLYANGKGFLSENYLQRIAPQPPKLPQPHKGGKKGK